MHSEDIITGLTDSGVAQIRALIQALKDETPFRINRTPEERQALNSVDQGRRPFCDLCADYTRDHHEDLMIDATEVARTARIAYDFDKLSEIEIELASLLQGISDAKMQIGSNFYNTSLVVKDLVEVAIKRRKPGMEVLWDNIYKLFERAPRSKNGNGDNGSTVVTDNQPTA